MADVAGPAEVFKRACRGDGSSVYEVSLCAITNPLPTDLFQAQIDLSLDHCLSADTLIIPGVDDVRREIPLRALEVIRHAQQKGIRIASICTGAFVLAATGLLDGLPATTHWALEDLFRQQFPLVNLNPAVLYVDNDSLLTSAGAAAGIDLSLHLVRKDFGSAVASAVAKLTVMPLARQGGQAQFIDPSLPRQNGQSLSQLLEWIEGHLQEPLSSEQLARFLNVSPRTLHRYFMKHLGMPPNHYVQLTRLRHSQLLLETTTLSIEQVAETCGFGSSAHFRDRFRRQFNLSPKVYRQQFQEAQSP